MAINIDTVARVRRACESVRDLITDCKVRGPLCSADRAAVVRASRAALALQRALAALVASEPVLKVHLEEFAE